MVQVVGSYVYERSENFEDYLRRVGENLGQQQAATALVQSKPILQVEENSGSYVISVTNDGKSSSSTFKLGEAYEEKLPHGASLKSVTIRDGDKFLTESQLPNGNKSIRCYEFTDSGIIVHLSDVKTGVTAKRYYNRL